MRTTRIAPTSLGLCLLLGLPAHGEVWSRAYIRQLPDSAFAVVERRSDGTRVPHLPHHAASGDLDMPHLCSAIARWSQVKWIDPANAERARAHLQMQVGELPSAACLPGTRAQ